MKLDLKKIFLYSFNIVVLFLCFYLIKVKTVDSESLIWSAWSFSEMLISYPDNIFVRRGFLGEIFETIAGDGPAYSIVQNFIFYNFLLFMFSSSIFLYLSGIKLYQYSLFLISSFGFLNLVSYDIIYHRKEVFVFNLFIIFLLLLRKSSNKYIRFFVPIYLVILTVITCLVHEGMLIIFLPFIYVLVKESNIFSYRYIKLENLYLIFSGILSVIIILNKGTSQISNLIFENLHPYDKNLLKDYTVDGIRAIGWSLKRGLVLPLRVFLSGNAFYWLYILGLKFFTLYVISFSGSFNQFKTYVINLHKNNPILYLSYSIFLIGWDWGRWFIIIFYLYFFLFAYNGKRESRDNRYTLTVGVLVIYTVLSLGTIIPECCLSWTDPKILNNIEKYVGEIKFNY
ncbi:hypothetical protein N9O36_01540 [Acidimicrobiia bacterium]|nr:hypothetical protein [Acidimicrobiia bacterium]